MKHRNGRAERKPWTRAETLLLAAAVILSGLAGVSIYYAAHPPPSTAPSPEVIPQQIAPASGYTGKACSGVTTCSQAVTVQPFSVLLIMAVEYSDVALTFAVHSYTPTELEHYAGTTTYPASFVYGILYTASSSASLTAYVNYTSSEYYDIFVLDTVATVLTSTYYSGIGENNGASTAASASCTPSISGEEIVAVVGAKSSEATMAPGTGQTQLTAPTATTTNIVAGEDQYYVDSGTTAYSMTNTLATSGDWSVDCVGLEPTAVPTAPTSLASGSQTTTTVALTWSLTTSQASYVTAAEIWDAAYSGGACGGYSKALASSSPYTSGTVTGLTEGNFYCFEVDAYNSTGWSANSTALTDVQTETYPAAPTGVTAVAQTGTTTVLDVGWTQNPGNPATYANSTIFRTTTSACGGTKTYANDADPASSAYQLTGLTAGTTYYVEVAEWNSIAMGPWSSCVSGSTLSVPSAPTGLGTTGQSQSTVTLTWTQPSGTVANDTVSYGTPVTTPSPFCTSLTQVSTGSASSFTVSNLNPDTTYCFAVQAWNGGLASSFTAYLNVTTTATLPGQAYNLQETTATTSSATLTWTNVPPASPSTIVNVTVEYSSTGCGSLGTHISAGVASTYTVTGLAAHTSYCVGILEWSQSGSGVLSGTITMTALNPVPAAPTLSFVSASHSTITVSWAYSWTGGGWPIANGTVYYKTGGCSGAFTAVSTAGNTTSWQLSGLTAFTSYCLQVTTWTTGGQSADSNQLTEVTQSSTPPAPTDLSVQDGSATWLFLLWQNPASYTLYNNTVYASTAGGSCGTGYTIASGWGSIHSTHGVTDSYNLTGLTASSTYCVEVVAWDGASNLSAPLYWTTHGFSTNGTNGTLVFPSGSIGAMVFALVAVLLVGGTLYILSRREH